MDYPPTSTSHENWATNAPHRVLNIFSVRPLVGGSKRKKLQTSRWEKKSSQVTMAGLADTRLYSNVHFYPRQLKQTANTFYVVYLWSMFTWNFVTSELLFKLITCELFSSSFFFLLKRFLSWYPGYSSVHVDPCNLEGISTWTLYLI